MSNLVSSIKLPAALKGHFVMATFTLPFCFLLVPVLQDVHEKKAQLSAGNFTPNVRPCL